jgi:hypothetical protein
VDLITCSQVLHHLEADDAIALLHEVTRVAREGVVVSDLRRSWLAVGLLWMVSFPLGFHPVSRHDGMLSILRGYTAPERSHTVRHAVFNLPTAARLAALMGVIGHAGEGGTLQHVFLILPAEVFVRDLPRLVVTAGNEGEEGNSKCSVKDLGHEGAAKHSATLTRSFVGCQTKA